VLGNWASSMWEPYSMCVAPVRIAGRGVKMNTDTTLALGRGNGLRVDGFR
jgi:hypothetical protein